MAIQKTNRYLDTCPCVIYFEVDNGVFCNPSTINKCALHAEFADGQQHFDTIVADDLHRAHVLNKILSLLPDDLRVGEEGNYGFVKQPEIYYSEDYELVVNIDGLTIEQKADIAAAVNADDDIKQYGNHHVILG